ncbi:hypothetical protein D3C76_1771730 [compost metagenome]
MKVRQPQWPVTVSGVEHLIFLKIVLTLFGLDPALRVSDDADLVVIQKPLHIRLARLAVLEQAGADADALSA